MFARLSAPSEPGETRVHPRPGRDGQGWEPVSSSRARIRAGAEWRNPSHARDIASPYGL